MAISASGLQSIRSSRIPIVLGQRFLLSASATPLHTIRWSVIQESSIQSQDDRSPNYGSCYTTASVLLMSQLWMLNRPELFFRVHSTLRDKDMEYPLYTLTCGPRKGEVKTFIFVSREEYETIGLKKAKKLERDRIRSHKITSDPAEKAKWTARRRERRLTDPAVRERENELNRRYLRRRRVRAIKNAPR